MNKQPAFLLPVEKCQLCLKKKHQFTCNVCVLTGNFSKSIRSLENYEEGGGRNSYLSSQQTSFNNKQKRLHIVRNVKNEFQERLDEKLEKQANYNKKVTQLIILRNRIETLKCVLQESKSQNEREKEENNKFAESLAEKQKLVKRLRLKSDKLKNDYHLQEKKIKLHRYKTKLESKRESLKEIRISHINALVNNIFPISERTIFPTLGTSPRGISKYNADIGSDVVSESLSKSPEFDLEEATRTIHVEGKWISLKSEERETTIVDAGMPNSGDFIKYFVWLKSYRSEPRSTESNIILHDNEILNVPASLIYSAQLTDGMAFFLSINLPHQIEYINFGLLQVSRKKLVRTIDRLAENVMYLCCSQGIDENQLEPNAILKNLKTMIETRPESLGRTIPFEAIEFEPNECPFDSDSSAEELNFDTDSDSADGNTEEWDRLHDLPEPAMDPHYHSTSPSFDASRDRSLSSSASGLVTSAAASVASALWSWKR
ncbi:beclin 1-associated autophagy-related key regulator-like [Clytia hemisphaerica]|uniref:Beclin 1-associated autophagy-related key regulator n=1 Tax=Clytia hemisphaerica TaxID=252671 RepID=A0A7M5WVX5_9CNID|eukprot:TCONS_00019163-protein